MRRALLVSVFLLFSVQSVFAFAPTIPSVSEAIQKKIHDTQVNINLIEPNGVLGDPVAAPYFELKNPENASTLVAEDVLFQWGDVKPTDDALAYYVLTLKKIEAPGVTSDVFSVQANKDVRAFTPTELPEGNYEWFMSAMDASDSVLFVTEKRTFSITPAPILGEPPVDPTEDPTTDPTTDPASGPATDPVAVKDDTNNTDTTSPKNDHTANTDIEKVNQNNLQEPAVSGTKEIKGSMANKITESQELSAQKEQTVNKDDDKQKSNIIFWIVGLLGLLGGAFMLGRGKHVTGSDQTGQNNTENHTQNGDANNTSKPQEIPTEKSEEKHRTK